MSVPTSLTELLMASGDAACDWDLRADRIDWFGAWEKLFGETVPVNLTKGFHPLKSPRSSQQSAVSNQLNLKLSAER